MCRILFVLGKKNLFTDTKYLLEESTHSLVRQASEPQYLPGLLIRRLSPLSVKQYKNIQRRNPHFNQDGYGIYAIDMDDNIHYTKSSRNISQKRKFKVVDKVQRLIQKSPNVKYLLAEIRNNNFQSERKNNHSDCQPFVYKRHIFAHNGGFSTHFQKIHTQLHNELSPKYKNKDMSLDSKLLFFLLLSKFEKSPKNWSLVKRWNKAVKSTFMIINDLVPSDFNISFNLILSDIENDFHFTIRHRTCNELAPALYIKESPDGLLIASEPIDFELDWKLIPNNTAIYIHKQEIIKTHKINIC